MEIEIMIGGEERILTVDAKIVGRYYSGDYENPPEHPELEIYSIKDEEGNEFEPTQKDAERIADKVEEILLRENQ